MSGDVIEDAQCEFHKSRSFKNEMTGVHETFTDAHCSPVTSSEESPIDLGVPKSEWYEREFWLEERLQLAAQIAEVLQDLCDAHDDSVVVPHSSAPNAMFYSRTKQPISLQAYVERFVRHLDVSPAAFLAAMVYLGRAQNANGELRVSSYNIHRVFLTAVHLGIKFTEDIAYSAGTLARVGGVQSGSEVCSLERQMLSELKFDLFIQPALLQSAHLCA
eukprot:CAMPEP_0185844238 /NCGR_PEP_ID=MMETSP1354-20130828/471_1 /TAXON_ID=708628 /ORGANISM="Erythrolobus madagascarensis, Strain CCMP3276" /LENGTH=217 /DNA_ID=CAMNT_0028543865 /DNA_START=153 /DNA_END=806 /DNA_ORIENTATION=-